MQYLPPSSLPLHQNLSLELVPVQDLGLVHIDLERCSSIQVIMVLIHEMGGYKLQPCSHAHQSPLEMETFAAGMVTARDSPGMWIFTIYSGKDVSCSQP